MERYRISHRDTLSAVLCIAIASLLIAIPASAQVPEDIAEAAYRHAMPLDISMDLAEAAEYDGKEYYVIWYVNRLSFASGIQLFSEDGNLVKDFRTAKAVFRIIGWQKAVASINQSDIDAFQSTLRTASDVNDLLAPARSTTNFIIQKLDQIKNMRTVWFGKVSIPTTIVWDALQAAYPDISDLERNLRSIDRSLQSWDQMTLQLTDHLPRVVDGRHEVMQGADVGADFSNNVEKCILALSGLRAESDKVVRVLSDAHATLLDAEDAIRKGAKTTSGGKYIRRLADYVGELAYEVGTLGEVPASFSDTIAGQQSKLSRVVSQANSEGDRLYESWDSRRGAPGRLLGLAGGPWAMLLGLTVALALHRKKRLSLIFLSILLVVSITVGVMAMGKPTGLSPATAPASEAGSAIKEAWSAWKKGDVADAERLATSLSETADERHLLFLVQDKPPFRAVGGIQIHGLLSHAFLKQYAWTPDFDQRRYIFSLKANGFA